MLLLIETSQTTCSVALASDTDIILQYVNHEPMQHATCLPTYIQQTLDYARERRLTIEAVAISGGPGSYTGLRIGVSTAKGIAYALHIPLIAVDTLQIMALQMIKLSSPAPGTLICPMIDARRMEVYTAIYDYQGNLVGAPQARIVDAGSYSDIDSSHKIIFGGNGAAKCQPVITRPQCYWLDNIDPTAHQMLPIAIDLFKRNKTVDAAYYEPFYLKEFQATTPKKTI